MLKVIGGVPDGEYKAVASGTLPNGKPVVVNSDGTVSVAGETDVSSSVGTATNFNNSNTIQTSAAYDSTNNKVVLFYRDYLTTNYGMAIVGTVSGSSISFGTEVTFNTGTPNYTIARFDESTGKIVVVFGDGTNSNYGTAIVGTVSGTSISFGSKVVFNSAEAQSFGLCYESTAQKMVISYRDEGDTNNGNAIVGTVSGTSISFGSEATFDTDTIADTRLAYDSNAGKVVVAYRNGTESNRGYAAVGTVTGTSISFGTRVLFNGGTGVTSNIDIAYDENAQKVVIAYKDGANSDAGAAIVGTVSGTSISFGTEAVFSVGTPEYISVVYHAAAKKVVITYEDTGNLQYGTAKACNISGTSLTFDSAIIFKNAEMNWTAATYDSTTEQIVVAYRDNDNSNNGYAVVLQIAYTATNLTAENYIGMSRGVVDSVDAVVGTESVFDTTTFGILDSVSVYDPDTQKTIIAYADRDNGDAVTAVVATVTGTTFSFGTPVVAHAGSDTEQLGIAYDTTNDRVVICYKNVGNSNHGTAVVGQVSGTSITFGTPVVFAAASTSYPSPAFDANSGKIVISYMDSDNSNYGTAIVGTVSGTSISFGTEVVFNSGTSQFMSTVYDPSSQKTVIAYRDSSVLNRGEAIVGTVSGTSISFGSVTLFDSTSGHEADNISAAYDPDTQQVIVAYREDGSPTGFKTHGRAVVGSVSGTSITFGDPASFNAVSTQYIAAGYDTVANKVVVAYRDRSNSDYGTVVAGSITGTSLSFETPVVYSGTDAVIYIGASYNESAGSFVISYRDMTSLDGTAVAYQASYIQRYPVADEDNASLDIIGSVSDNQLSLTAGEKYYVQTDGTLSTTAGSPSVLAGTAISATKLVVKT